MTTWRVTRRLHDDEWELARRFSSLSLALCLCPTVSRTPRPRCSLLFFSFSLLVRPTCRVLLRVFAARRTSRTNLNIYGELHDSAAAAVGSSPNELTSASRAPKPPRDVFFKSFPSRRHELVPTRFPTYYAIIIVFEITLYPHAIHIIRFDAIYV